MHEELEISIPPRGERGSWFEETFENAVSLAAERMRGPFEDYDPTGFLAEARARDILRAFASYLADLGALHGWTKVGWRSFDTAEYATLEWVDWLNNRRLLEPIGSIPPAGVEANFYAALETWDMTA